MAQDTLPGFSLRLRAALRGSRARPSLPWPEISRFIDSLKRRLSGSEVQEFLHILISSQNQDRLIRLEAVIAARNGHQLFSPFGSQDIDAVPLPHA